MTGAKDTMDRANQPAGSSDHTAEEQAVFFRLALDMFCIANFDGYFLQLNPIWEDTLGFSLETLKSKPFIEFIHPADRQATVVETEKLRQDLNTIAFEHRFLCQDGAYKWLLWNATVSTDHERYYAVGRDITTSKQAQEALRENETRYRDLIESSCDLLQIIAPDSHFVG